MQLELKRIQQEVGITFIYVTHDQEEAMTMSDRLAVMQQGAIEQIGGPEEIYEHPRTIFVAGFLGASNLLAGEVTGMSNGRTSIRTTGGDVVMADSEKVPQGIGRPVRVGVRPEKISIVAGDLVPPSDRNHISGVVRMSTYIGVNYQYEVEAPGGHMMRVRAVRA
jgi:spermidine/putrescine transport system ATP-binding protein